VGSSACTRCVAGTYSASGKGVCTSCGAGYYQSGDGSSSCQSCPLGTYLSSIRAASFKAQLVRPSRAFARCVPPAATTRAGSPRDTDRSATGAIKYSNTYKTLRLTLNFTVYSFQLYT
jgi:hypothetical protein